MIGDESSVLPVASSQKSVTQSQVAHFATHTLLCTDLIGSLSEDSVLQIMSDSTAVAVTAKNLPTSATDLGALNLPILLTDKKSQSIDGENVSDIDLSFLNEGMSIIPDTKHLNAVKELQGMMPSPQSLNGSQHQEQSEIEGNSGEGNMVMIDVTKPIQLSQNSLIMVNGQKCVLQHDSRTGQVVAYPVKEQISRPRRRRGRPRKTSMEQMFKNFVQSEKNPTQETEIFSEEEREKGLLEVVNDDGSLVRRSSRKRKKAKVLKDYETGNLQHELGSDVDNVEDGDMEPFNRRKKLKGPGRPRKLTNSFENISENKESDAKRPRGRPRKAILESEATQAFLVQTADGQTLMLQVPLSSIPEGTTLQEMAQEIANKLNVGFNQANPATVSTAEKICVENESILEPALQDHSIGSTTNFSSQQPQLSNSHSIMDIIGEEICESEEITLECDQSLNDVTSAANLGEENNLNTSESLEDNFCLDVSSTTTSTSVDGAAPMLCNFNEHLIDHSFYVVKQNSSKAVLLTEDKTSVQRIMDEQSGKLRDSMDFQLFQSSEVEDRVESVVAADSKLDSSDPKDLFSTVNEIQNMTCNEVLMRDQNNAAHGEHLTEELPVCPSKEGVLTVLLQESLTEDHSTAFSAPEKLNPVIHPAEIPSGPKKCKICMVPYETEEEMVEHFKAKHPKCICLECNYMSEHPYGLKRHSYRHINEEFVCNICNKKYKDAYILKMHVKMVHLPPEVLFKCNVCNKEFTRKAHLKRHQRIHAPVKQYQCPLCDYHGCEKSDVTKHLLIHEEPKFKCEFCGKAFRHLKNKELHIKRHSGQRDYKCAACNFYGYTYTDTRKHIERRHSSICHLCKQVFPDAELCKEHKRLGLCQSSLLEGSGSAKMEECPPPTLDDKKEIILFGEMSLDI